MNDTKEVEGKRRQHLVCMCPEIGYHRAVEVEDVANGQLAVRNGSGNVADAIIRGRKGLVPPPPAKASPAGGKKTGEHQPAEGVV